MSVLDRAALEQSPLADLHAIASELSIDGYRRLRRADLIEAILGGEGASSAAASSAASASASDETGDETPDDGRDGSAAVAGDEISVEARDGSAAVAGDETSVEARDGSAAEAGDETSVEARDGSAAEAGDEASVEADEPSSARRRRGRRGGRGRAAARDEAQIAADEDGGEGQAEPRADEESVEGVVELLPNGSGFVRVQPPDPSDEDVYISAAQVKRCELVSGDRVAGPRRPPRRSERFASLVRIDLVNGRPASELADGARFDDLPAALPDERFRLGSEDPTIKAIEWLTPFGRGSRVTIVGGPRAGKTEALRRLTAALAGQDDLQISVSLAGVRPEEISAWASGPIEPTAAVSFAASSDMQDQAVELVIDQARRIAARGAHAVVLVDTLDGLHPYAARRALAAARNIVDGGSLTVVATASAPIGGETTVIALEGSLTSTGRFPAMDLAASGTIRPDLLVGEAGAEAIAHARIEALDA